MNKLDLLKSHVDQYTRKDGTVVQAHDDKRVAAQPDLGPHKAGDTVSYKGVRGSTRTGTVKGSRDGKVVVEHAAGYTELKHHSELSAKPAAPVPPDGAGDGDVGSEERKTYGKYFKKGDKVVDGSGNRHVVAEHNGPVVRTESGKTFHPTKLGLA